MLNDNDKKILECQLNKVYDLMKLLENSKIKGTIEYSILFELENINLKFDIPFND